MNKVCSFSSLCWFCFSRSLEDLVSIFSFSKEENVMCSPKSRNDQWGQRCWHGVQSLALLWLTRRTGHNIQHMVLLVWAFNCLLKPNDRRWQENRNLITRLFFLENGGRESSGLGPWPYQSGAFNSLPCSFFSVSQFQWACMFVWNWINSMERKG